MKLFSTNDKTNIVDLRTAVLKSLPADKGLYMPLHIPELDKRFIENIDSYSFVEIAFIVSSTLLGEYIPPSDLYSIVSKAINFPAPVKSITTNISTLELFHGPSLAFKDFGARYMAELMSYFTKKGESKITILVATSGDTGGAVAAGFYDTPGIDVLILYPSGRVSALQEKQLTTLGKNISACEVNGSFDDCQALVKEAFLDHELNKKYNLSSANSINIARLIPQSFYYFEAFKQLKNKSNVVFCVPSGNFGNLTAGLFSKKMGLPVQRFIAATNKNDVVPRYLETGTYSPLESVSTISNAMDVGAPSNFSRILELYKSDWASIKKDIVGFSFTDEETKRAMQHVYKNHNYICDPHGAVGFLAAEEFLKSNNGKQVVFLETAHPSKFLDVVEPCLETKVEVPARLASLANKTKKAEVLSPAFDDFKSYLLNR